MLPLRPVTAEQRAAVLAAINTWAQAASFCSDLVFEQAADVPNAAPVPQDGKTPAEKGRGPLRVAKLLLELAPVRNPAG
ncbi:MAG TPA: hypothetical protein VK539_39525 [Myxococcaceae bacterium]|nr:hypothetical protein [Myxococcaceae bacterium]